MGKNNKGELPFDTLEKASQILRDDGFILEHSMVTLECIITNPKVAMILFGTEWAQRQIDLLYCLQEDDRQQAYEDLKLFLESHTPTEKT